MADSDWTWKERDGGSGRLLYEPGNWGDLLKNLWVFLVLQWLLEVRPGQDTSYSDPFAGAPAYPLTRNTVKRLAGTGIGKQPVFAAFFERGLWPSAASLARCLTRGVCQVYDQEAGRRDEWRSQAGFSLVEVADGWEWLAQTPTGKGFWLVDPYDFLAVWEEWLPSLLTLAKHATVQLYVYNRSAGGGAQLANYRRFRAALEEGRDGLGYLRGRLASDAFLPRAHHEVFLLPAPGVVEAAADRVLAGRLAEATRVLSRAQEKMYQFETGGFTTGPVEGS
ncbi:MAG: hypothetical protein LBU79_00910 [Planctomycetota bacterium]|jgi:hypothetical protein|nr:hypothetical protein [Planctomycetota bacterium]